MLSEPRHFPVLNLGLRPVITATPHCFKGIWEHSVNHFRQKNINSQTNEVYHHKLSRVSKSLTALFGMRHLTYRTNFLHLFAFLVSRPPQSALLHRQALTLLLNRWLACLTGSSILVLKLTFSPDPFPRNLPLPNGLISRFYPARVRKSLALKILVSAAD